MSYFFSEKEQQKYLDDGFVCRESQFSQKEIISFRKIFERTVKKAHSISDTKHVREVINYSRAYPEHC